MTAPPPLEPAPADARALRAEPHRDAPRPGSARVAAALALATFALLVATAAPIGLTRDEGFYVRAAGNALGWLRLLLSAPLEALGAPAITRFWQYNSEHPALVKLLAGAARGVLHDGLGLPLALSCRFPGLLAGALVPALLYLVASRLVGRRAALAAALVYATLARPFFHAHLVAFDVPVCAAWLGVTLAVLRTVDPAGLAGGAPAWRRAALVGLAWGLALCAKLNAFFLPPLLLLWGAGAAWASAPDARGPLLRQAGRVALAMLVLAPLVFLAHWPWLWHDPVQHTLDYVRFHLRHEHYTVAYFGRLLRSPPFPVEFPFVMTAATIEPPVLLAALVGLALAARDTARRACRAFAPDGAPPGAALFVLLNVAVPLGVMALPDTPRFGGVKHWLVAYAFLCVAAAGALAWATRRLPRPRAVWAVGVAALTLPGLAGLVASYPHGTAAWSSTVGGLRGAADHDLQRAYWTHVSPPLLADLDARAARGDRIFWHDLGGDQLATYREDGRSRAELGTAGRPRDAAFAFYYVEQRWPDVEYELWDALGTRRPVAGVYVDEVPLAFLYARR